MKKRDLILIAAALVLAGALYAVSQLSLGVQASTIVVTVDGQERLRRPSQVSTYFKLGDVRASSSHLRNGFMVRPLVRY